jgi:hypothetical protein
LWSGPLPETKRSRGVAATAKAKYSTKVEADDHLGKTKTAASTGVKRELNAEPLGV